MFGVPSVVLDCTARNVVGDQCTVLVRMGSDVLAALQDERSISCCCMLSKGRKSHHPGMYSARLRVSQLSGGPNMPITKG